MTLKLNDQQLEALFYYFEHNVIRETPENDLEIIAQRAALRHFFKNGQKAQDPFPPEQQPHPDA